MHDMIVKALIEYVDVPEESITAQTDFINDLHMNSYDFVSLVGELEDTLCIEIPDNEIRGLRTVGDVEEYLKSKIK